MRHLLRALLAGGLGLAVSFLVACGGGTGLLSTDQAGTLNSQLDQVSSDVAVGNCAAAANALSGFSAAIPGAINPTLRDNLSQGATYIDHYVAQDCKSNAATTTPTTATTSPTTSSTPSTTAPPSTNATTSNPANTSTQPATPPGNPGTSTGGGSGGAGIGGGKGGGGGTGNGGAGSGGAGAGGGNGQ